MSTKQLLLLADATVATGVGHHVRSAALAEAAAARGWTVTFGIQQETVPWVVDDVRDRGWGVVHLDLSTDRVVRAATHLGTGGDVTLLVDTYRVDESWFEEMRARLPGTLLVIDDLADRTLHADVVVNQNVGAEDYAIRADPDTDLLLGPQFALLRPEFAALRAASLEGIAELGDVPRTVLVVMGGTDPTGSAITVAQACLDAFPDATVTVVASAGFDGEDSRLMVVPRVLDMASTMLATDLVVTAAGSTVWELCCLARPAAAVQVADNQADVYRRLTTAGVVVGLGAIPIKRDDAALVLDSISKRPGLLRALATQAGALVDGRGAERVVKHLESRMGRDKP